MPLYEVSLKSTTDDQRRTMTVDADDEKAARALANEQEKALVAFSLPDVAEVEETTTVESDGRVVGPSARARANLHAHYQAKPYKVTKVELFVPNIAQVVAAVKQLQEHKGAWENTLKALKEAGVALNVVTGSIFGLQAQKQLDGSASIVWSSATIKVALTTSSWTPNQDTHDFFDDVTNEVTGTGYTAGGATLGTKTSTYDTATDTIRLDAADTTWTTSTITARRAAIYNDTVGAASTDPVMGWVDFGADFSTTAGTFQITWDATGIFVWDVT